MGKPRRIARPKKVQENKLVYDESLSKADVPSSKELSSEYYNDEIDQYHEEKFQSLMAKGVQLDSDEEQYDSEDEVMPLDIEDEDEEDDDEDDEDDEDEEDHNEEKIGKDNHNEEEEEDDDFSMGSDIEGREDEGLPNEMAWGRWKMAFYNTDYKEEQKKVKKKKTKEELEAEAADEEEEAQNIQRRLANTLNEEDYGLDFIQEFAEKPSEETPSASDQKIVKDLNTMSDKEKRKLLKKESPELIELIQDLKQKLAEVKNELQPLMKMVNDGIIPKGKTSAYLQGKYQLYLNYCTNISYYLQLKAKRIPITGHPVIQRLLMYRSMINELADVDARLAPEISLLLSVEGQKKLSEGTLHISQPKPKKAAVKRPAVQADEDSDLDEEAALNYYRMMENKLLEKRKLAAENKIEASEDMDPNEKRGITYQIAKNKGLTPKRKKIDRNPRVKHREKFRRAKIRRKGQVREVRTETARYSGELSGIRAGVKKSIKLKF